MKKETVIAILDGFEDEFEVERFLKQILFADKIEKGLKDVEEGKVSDYKKVKNKFLKD